jgi:hypothetical protein
MLSRDLVSLLATYSMSGLRVLIPTYVPQVRDTNPEDSQRHVSAETRKTISDMLAIGAIEPSDVLIHENCALLVQSRAELLARAYADPDAQELLLLDSDVGVGAGTIQAMRSLDLMAVGCGYAGRSAAMARSIMGVQSQPTHVETLCGHRLLRVRHMAHGCMLLRREAVDALYDVCEHFVTPTGYDAISPWTPLVRRIDGVPRLLDEGYSCCNRLSELGIETWLFLDAIVSHAGRTCFAGSLYPET